MTERPAVIIDCDPGHDDTVALVVAAAHTELVGITTVSGNAPLIDVTRNALAVVELFGIDAPVHAGAERPLVAPARHAPAVHGERGLGGTSLPAPTRAAGGEHAVEFLIEATRARPGCWLVPVGPLTNIALAIRLDPTILERIAGISLMGGGATIGNVTPTAEFNVWADPEAAAIVFEAGARAAPQSGKPGARAAPQSGKPGARAAPQSGKTEVKVPLRMAGLDVTHQVRMTAADGDRLRAADDPAGRGAFLADVLAYYGRSGREGSSPDGSPMHDPLAVLAVTHPHLFTHHRRPVHIELAGTTRGMTVVDRRAHASADTATCDVAEVVDAPAVRALILDTLLDACSPPPG